MTPASPPPFTPAASTRRRPLISLTPLIDVVFILLVFFMLASSFLDWRAIDLNASQRTAAGSSMQGSMLVEVGTAGIRLAGRAITPEALEETVRRQIEEDASVRVLVKPAPGVDLQQTVGVLDRLSAAGAGDLTLIRDPEPGR